MNQPLIQSTVFVSLEDAAFSKALFPDVLLKKCSTLTDLKETFNTESLQSALPISLNNYISDRSNKLPKLEQFSQIAQIMYMANTLLAPQNRDVFLCELIERLKVFKYSPQYSAENAKNLKKEFFNKIIERVWIPVRANIDNLIIWKNNLESEKNKLKYNFSKDDIREMYNYWGHYINKWRHIVLQKSCDYCKIFSPKTLAKSIVLLDYLGAKDAIMQPAIDILLLSGSYDALKTSSKNLSYFNKLKPLKKEYQYDIEKLLKDNPKSIETPNRNRLADAIWIQHANLLSINGLENIDYIRSTKDKHQIYYLNLAGNNIRRARLPWIRQHMPDVRGFDFKGNKNIHIKTEDLHIPCLSSRDTDKNSLYVQNCNLTRFPLKALQNASAWDLHLKGNRFSAECIDKINYINKVRQLKQAYLLPSLMIGAGLLTFFIGCVGIRYIVNSSDAKIEANNTTAHHEWQETIKMHMQELTQKYGSDSLKNSIHLLRPYPDIMPMHELEKIVPEYYADHVTVDKNIGAPKILEIISAINQLPVKPDVASNGYIFSKLLVGIGGGVVNFVISCIPASAVERMLEYIWCPHSIYL